MKKILFILFCLTTLYAGHAQKEAAIWYFGENAGLDFNSGTPVPLTDGALNTFEGCATISDPTGSLMFYTNGVEIWNRNHLIMPNGTSLLGGSSSSQSAIIVPKPQDSNTYYVFTVRPHAYGGLHYSEVDMTLDGALGDVSVKNIPLVSFTSEKINAVQHANGRDIWVITHNWGDDAFMAFLVTPAGVNTTPVVSNVGHVLDPFNRDSSHGYLKVSPNGEHLAVCHLNATAELFDFDDLTGVVSNPTPLLPDGSTYYGVEFSPNSELVYVSYGNTLMQFQVNAPDVAASKIQVGSSYVMGALQQAIDGKIYASNFTETHLGVINDPNQIGAACNFDADGLDLMGREAALGLPPFIQSFFLVSFNVENFCLGDSTEFSLNTSEPVLSANWDFGDGNTSTMESPTHTYLSAGDYTVNVTVTTASETKTETEDITIYTVPVANAPVHFEVCNLVQNYEFDLTDKDAEVLGSQSATEFAVGYYSSLTDAQNNSNKLPDLYTNTLATETIYVRIANVEDGSCHAITNFDIRVKLAPELHVALDWTVCDTDTDGFYDFDLSQKDVEIYNGQDTGVFTVTYFETQTDADSNTNTIGPNHTNTSATQQIFYRIQNTTHNECYETGNFTIEVITGATANAPTTLEICDDNNDGFFTFDLTDVETEVLGSQNSASFNVSYHSSLTDAENGLNAHSIKYTNTSPDSETVYVRVENNSNSNCFATTSFELQVYDSPIMQSVSDWLVCDSDNDGTYTFDLTQKGNEVLGGQSPADFGITYHLTQADADVNQNAISNTFSNTTNPQIIYYRLQSGANAHCFVTESFLLQVFDQPMATNPSDENVCANDETGINSFDLSQKDVEVLNGQDAVQYQVSYFGSQADALNNSSSLPKNAYSNTTAEDTLFARVHHIELVDCFAVSQFTILVSSLAQPDLEEMYVICPDSPELTIDGGDFESWSWEFGTNEISTDRTISITELGDYSLTVSQTNNGIGCENTVTFEVVSSGAPDDFTTEIKGFSDTVIIEVSATGEGDFEYSVDGENFQDSNELEVFPGVYTVFVRDKFLCRTISKEIIALGYQKFFTPNGDGVHEYWNIIGAELFPESQLYIFDRYGKLLSQISPLSPGWDGTYNGVELPSSDYWFRYSYDNGKVFTGHFTLKR